MCVREKSAIKSDKFQTVLSTTVVALSRWIICHNLHLHTRNYKEKLRTNIK